MKLSKETQESLEFHIKSQDFFGYGATYIGFIIETLKNVEITADVKQSLEIAEEFQKELIHLQHEGYKIIKE